MKISRFSSVGIQFEPRDCWVGGYWTWHSGSFISQLKVYICVVPCFPLVICLVLERDTAARQP